MQLRQGRGEKHTYALSSLQFEPQQLLVGMGSLSKREKVHRQEGRVLSTRCSIQVMTISSAIRMRQIGTDGQLKRESVRSRVHACRPCIRILMQTKWTMPKKNMVKICEEGQLV